LLTEIVAYCKANGFELIVAWPADDAYGFYEHHGFERPSDPVVCRLPR
jgi:hypothetical protein